MTKTTNTRLPELQPGDSVTVHSIEHAHAICQWEALRQKKTITLRVHKGRKNIDITYTPEQAQHAFEQEAHQILREQRRP